MEVLKVSEQELFGDNKNPAPDEGEAELDEFIARYRAASPELREAILALLKAAE